MQKLGAIQFREGSMYHQFFPLSGEGDGGNSFSDDALWYVMTVAEYIKATGDWAVLAVDVPWSDDPVPSPLYEHLLAAIRYTQRMRGPHGLPLILLADWNDMLQISGMTWGEDHHGRDNLRAESVMVAFLYRKALTEFAELARRTGRADQAEEFIAERAALQENIDRHAWDGAWFRRAYDNDGNVLGGAGAPEGEVWLNAQTWAVLSGAATGDRARQAMQTVADRLETKYGLILLDPPYPHWIKENPSITTYPPGLKENGGIFCHTNPWGVIAHCLLGNGDQAMDYFRRIMPTTHQQMQETYRAEPYIYAQMIAGRHHPQFGLARNSWLTGAVAWNYVAASNHIMGVQPDYEGLRFDPCLPAAWTTCQVRRQFRGILFDVTIEKQAGICRAARDGDRITGIAIRSDYGTVEGNLLKLDPTVPAPATVKVAVRIS
jgi:cellobiose phosphorylase